MCNIKPLILICLVFLVSCTQSRSPLPSELVPAEYSPPGNEQKRWALATCGILTAGNNDDLGRLGGKSRSVDSTEDMRRSLKYWWGIRSRNDLLKDLQWLAEEGHRVKYDKIGRLIAFMPPGEFQQLRESVKDNPEFNNKLDIVMEYYDELKPTGIDGWDYARYVALCGWGYIAGYLSEEEAWQLIMPMAQLIQEQFDSWESLGKSHIIGRKFWSLKHTKKTGDQMLAGYQRLLHSADSPWNTIRWDLPLGRM